jgi:hypothetical protein
MNMAARLSLDLPMMFEYLTVELRLFEGWALRALVNFRMLYRRNLIGLISCFKSFLDTSTGPSKFWITSPGPKPRPSTPISRQINHRLRNLRLYEEILLDVVYSPETLDPLAPRIDKDQSGGDGEDDPSVPAWLHNVFREEIGGPMLALASPLVGPSDIRAKYLSALQSEACYYG